MSAKTLAACCTAVCLARGHLLQIALKSFMSWSAELFSALSFMHFGVLIQAVHDVPADKARVRGSVHTPIK